jgi:flagellar hook-associated protein FlgK
MQGLGQRLVGIRDDLQTSLTTDIAKVNDLTSSIASLNQQIRSQVNLGNQPNDLFDRRALLLQELTNYLDVRVRLNPVDQSVLVDVNGNLLIGVDDAIRLTVSQNAGGSMAVLNGAGFAIDPSGGRIGATYELHSSILPAIQDQVDTLAATVARQLNGLHATGTNHAVRALSYTAEYGVPVNTGTTDLDDPSQIQGGEGQAGIPAAFMPSYTDSNGVVTTRNLSINITDSASGLARKYTVRYDPADGNRSLTDLVAAINTGRGGGFTLYPDQAAGIDGLNARMIQVDGGLKLELATNRPGLSIDFSQALDNQPSASTWTGSAVTVSGTLTTPIPAQRLNVAVENGGTRLRLTWRDPGTGAVTNLGTAAIPASGVSAVAVGGLTVTIPAGTWRDGDAFGVGVAVGGQVLDAAGAPGAYTKTATWVAADASMTVRGRYTGNLSFDPAQPWSMKVMTAGVIGAKSDVAPPNNPPQVQFTYWTGSATAPTQQTMIRTLDESYAAGRPVEIADGVYAVFGAGTLATVGSTLDFTVDGQPDQAGLLPALGINGMFQGASRATTIGVEAELSADPNRFAVARSRNEGDNSNLTEILNLRKQLLFSNGSFAMDDFYQSAVAGIGVQIQQAQRLGENQDALKASLSNQREQVSGVNIDEEVGAMMLQQQAYTAAARIITTARENIQTLLDIIR